MEFLHFKSYESARASGYYIFQDIHTKDRVLAKTEFLITKLTRVSNDYDLDSLNNDLYKSWQLKQIRESQKETNKFQEQLQQFNESGNAFSILETE